MTYELELVRCGEYQQTEGRLLQLEKWLESEIFEIAILFGDQWMVSNACGLFVVFLFIDNSKLLTFF